MLPRSGLLALSSYLGHERHRATMYKLWASVSRRFALTPPGSLEVFFPAPVSTRYTSTVLDWSDCPAVERVPGKVSGEWVFRSTRVPVRALFENIEGGATVSQFLEWFPGVTREQVDAVLGHASRSLAPSA